MPFPKSAFIAVGLSLMLSANTFAMSGLEFIKLDDGHAERKALEPIIFQFVSKGYKNVPDWPKLDTKVREIVLKKGYGNQSLDRIAEEAATQLGMSR